MRVTLVGPWRNVRSSPVFSMPVCRYPMIGLDRKTVSPSSSNMSRSTPWVDGCDGPMLMIMRSSSRGPRGAVSSPAASRSDMRRTAEESRRRARSSDEVSVVVVIASTGRGSGFELHRNAADGVVLAQRVADPVFGHQYAREIGVIVELDAEHVVDLALES